MIDTDRFRRDLLDRRERVAAAIRHLQEEHPGSLNDETGDLMSSSSMDQHLADTATETFDRELDYSLGEASEHVLAEIDAALKRIDEGTFGVCAACGNEIDAERLEAVPYATLCIEDKRKQERR